MEEKRSQLKIEGRRLKRKTNLQIRQLLLH